MTNKNKSTTKACSLALELEQLEYAAEAVTVLTNLVRDKRTANDDEATRLPILSAAVASMLGSRLRDLRRVVRGQRDPREFWNPACDASPTLSASDDQDVRFPAWSGERSEMASDALARFMTETSGKSGAGHPERRKAR